MNPAGVGAILDEAVRRIGAAFSPRRILLFGSAAAGTMTNDSDIDLLVVMPFTGRRRDAAVAILDLLAGIGIAKDVVVLSPEEFERDKDVPGTIAWPAARHGKVLYAA